MSQVWKNLEYLESTYEQFFLKTHRIQSNRVCLGDLTGKIKLKLCIRAFILNLNDKQI